MSGATLTPVQVGLLALLAGGGRAMRLTRGWVAVGADGVEVGRVEVGRVDERTVRRLRAAGLVVSVVEARLYVRLDLTAEGRARAARG